MSGPDPHDLNRFVEAQQGFFEAARAELRGGRKASHWMWFVFPQIAGLGHSPMARRYAIASLAEARAYLAHPVLAPRLRELAEIVVMLPDTDARAIFGDIDAIKFRSSMTLFDAVEPDGVFARALDRFFEGGRDPATLERI
ncbi:MAG TPA: DUF1810 domain-containing protein [Caulobacteraceae bacterium]|nr:DUF1810 domain-containing protein [Caulobacteraceae bacterium]